MIKKFLVQIESSAETHWHCNDEELRQALAHLARTAATIKTSGAVPMITVVRDETPESH